MTIFVGKKMLTIVILGGKEKKKTYKIRSRYKSNIECSDWSF